MGYVKPRSFWIRAKDFPDPYGEFFASDRHPSELSESDDYMYMKDSECIEFIEKLPGNRMLSRDEIERTLEEALEKGLGCIPFSMVNPILKSLGFDEEE